MFFIIGFAIITIGNINEYIINEEKSFEKLWKIFSSTTAIVIALTSFALIIYAFIIQIIIKSNKYKYDYIETPYYLGFLFTLSSLLLAFITFKFPEESAETQTGDAIQHIILNAGAGITTTIVGLIATLLLRDIADKNPSFDQENTLENNETKKEEILSDNNSEENGAIKTLIHEINRKNVEKNGVYISINNFFIRRH